MPTAAAIAGGSFLSSAFGARESRKAGEREAGAAREAAAIRSGAFREAAPIQAGGIREAGDVLQAGFQDFAGAQTRAGEVGVAGTGL